MAWPVPSEASSSGPTLPVVPLPWAAREPSRPLIILPVVRSQRARRCRKASIRKAKYGAAMLAGFAVVSLAKKIINSIPVVNLVTRPVLDFFPSILVGPALGAAVMYGIEEGDPLAARHVVREKAQRIRQELDVIVQDVSSEIQANAGELARVQGALEGVARVVTDSVSELERTMLPVAEREYRRLEAHARHAFQDVGGEGPRDRS